ncbi:hypothetical protein RJT34_00556 [Clitoria ternatea]|uniref:Uncharacterized protein n=1 Tax=Clitoria ternatea TaxID=43366 RepID=A0AAN9Q0Q6_CLITE
MSKEETMADPKTVETILKWLNELYTICKKIADVISKVPKDVEVIKGDLNRVQALIVAVAAAREELTGEEVRQAADMEIQILYVTPYNNIGVFLFLL